MSENILLLVINSTVALDNRMVPTTEVLHTAYPNQIAVARVRLGGGSCMKQGSDDRHAVA